MNRNTFNMHPARATDESTCQMAYAYWLAMLLCPDQQTRLHLLQKRAWTWLWSYEGEPHPI